MKAITPVLSLILLIIIVIVVIGFSFGFFGRIIDFLQSSAKEQLTTQTKQMTCLRIEAASGDTIYVRNCGSYPVSDFTITADGMFVNIINSL